MKSAHMMRWYLFVTLLSQWLNICCLFLWKESPRVAPPTKRPLPQGGPSHKTAILVLTTNAVIGEAEALQHLFVEDISAINNKGRTHPVEHLIVFG